MARRVVDLRPRSVPPRADDSPISAEAPRAASEEELTPARTETEGSAEESATPARTQDTEPPRPQARRRARRRRTPTVTVDSATAPGGGAGVEGAASLGGGESSPSGPPRRPLDPFSERLRTLEHEIDEALSHAGGRVDGGLLALARDAAEELLGFYADLGRAFMTGGAAEVFIRLRMIGTSDRVDDFGYDPAFAARIAPLLRFLYERWWRVELIGADRVPADGRVLLVANHSGGFFPYDGLMIAHGVREHRPGGGREVRPLVEDFVYHLPFVGASLARAGAVRASSENAERLLTGEQAIAVFPEGAKGIGKYYRERYRLQRFARGGFVALALRTAAPLVPVAVIGAEEIHPIIAKWQWLARMIGLPYVPLTPTFPWLGVLGLLPLPSKWRIVFGDPIDLTALHGGGAHDDDLLVNRLKEQIRERIQRMVVDGLRSRDSVFTG